MLQIQWVYRFNSNMVRLKVISLRMYAAHLLFQFQYGAIKGKAQAKKTGGCGLFQFQYGAIKGKPIRS